MGDIDFDELDKAVNNLMGKASASPSDDDPQPRTLDISTTLQPGEKPTHSKVNTLVQNIGGDVTDAQRTVVADLLSSSGASTLTPPVLPVETIPVPATSVAIPSTPAVPVAPAVPRPTSGRFMDVVHPSSDMKTSLTAPSLVVPERDVPTITPSEVAFDSAEPVTPVLELSSITAPVLEPVAPTVESIAPVVPPVTEDVPPLTPFLPDAKEKIEKRPLGVVSFAESPLAEVIEPAQAPVEPILPVVPPAVEEENLTVDETQPINGEFDKSASENTRGEDQRIVEPTSVIIPTTADEKLALSLESTEVIGADAVVESEQQESVQAVESGDTGHLSVGTSQPQPVTDTSDDKTGDVFDVKNNNHQSIYPVKQKSGWLTVMIVILVIILCVGIAAAAYFILGLGLSS